MTAGPVNRVLLESNFQNDGEIYSDEKTEACFDVVADQIDDNWNYTASLVANGTLSPYPSFLSRQALINGNFDIWQRNIVFTNPSTFSYTADRWKVSFANTGTLPTTIIHSRTPLTPGDIANTSFFYRINPNTAGSGFGVNDSYGIQQVIKNGTRYLCGDGKKITISFYAKSDILNKKLGVHATQTYGTNGTPSSNEQLIGNIITLTSSWTKYTVTVTTNTLVGKTFGLDINDTLNINFNVMFGSTFALARYGQSVSENFGGGGSIDIAQVQVNSGDVALPFQPKSIDEEMNDCSFYYTKSYAQGTFPGVGTANGAVAYQTRTPVAASTSSTMFCFVPFKRVMNGTPVVTLYSSSGTANAIRVALTTDRTGASANFISDTGFSFIALNNASATVIAADNIIDFQYVAEAEL